MKYKKQFKEMSDVMFTAPMVMKGTDVMKHYNNPTALGGDIEGFASLGVAGGVGQAMFGMVSGSFTKKKKK